jgi:glycosyltransferase involved in cell wall biosynthesis
MTCGRVSIVLPVVNEAGNIQACLRGLAEALRSLDHEILICYDFDEDSTLPAIAAMPDRPPGVRLVKNTIGPGVVNALKTGFREAAGDVIVTTMADLSDPPSVIPAMVDKIRREGADVVSGSRYMRGGSQSGGPLLKRLLSRAAGLSLHWIAGVPTHDATTNFRAYRADFVRATTVESRGGFEVATELTVKAHLGGRRIAEVPSSWKDRTAGESRFRLRAWLPRYLRWYGKAMAAPLLVLGLWAGLLASALLFVWNFAIPLPSSDEWKMVPYVTGDEPVTMQWLWSPHNEHRIVLPKLIYLPLARLSRMDARPAAMVNALLLAGSALLLCVAARRFRGRTVVSDAFFPLLLLHWGHWANLCFPFQITLLLPGFLFCLLVPLLFSFNTRPDRVDTPIGLILCALPLCGAAGLPVAAVLGSWLLVSGIRRRRWAVSSLALIALVLTASVLIASRDLLHSSAHPGLASSFHAGAKCLVMGLGARARFLWPAAGLLVTALLAGSAVLLRRARATGALLGMGSLVALAFVIGHGRADQAYHDGFVERYGALMAPLLAFIYLSFDRAGDRFVPAALAGLLLALFLPNAKEGVGWMRPVRDRGRGVLQEIRAGIPLSDLARREAAFWDAGDVNFEARLRMLSKARMSLFR